MRRERDVLQVITSTQRRGAEQFAVGLETELRRRGLAVDTVALSTAPGDGLDVRALGDSPLHPSTLRALRAEMSASSVVAAHGSVTLPACALAGVGVSTPFVYRNIGDPNFWGSSWRRRTQSRLLLSRAVGVVALSGITRERVSSAYHVPLDKIEVIPRGVPAEVFSPPSEHDERDARERHAVPASGPVALFLGSLTEEKNVLGAVATMEHLPEWTLLVVGEGPDRQEAEAMADSVAPGRVVFHGLSSDPASAHAAADVVLVPSHTEGLPGVAIEAAMMHRPAVVTRVGFVEDIVDDGRTGRIVDTPDPAQLADAMLQVYGQRQSMGAAARRKVMERFSMQVVADRWADLLERQLRRRIDPAGSGGDPAGSGETVR